MLAAKMKAIQSLSQAESTTFSWKDFKRACKMISIWDASKRDDHMRRVRQPAEDKAEAEIYAMVAARTTSVEEVNAMTGAGVQSRQKILDMIKARIAKDAEEEKKQ